MNKEIIANLQKIIGLLSEASRRDTFVIIRNNDGWHRISALEIIYCESFNSSTTFYLTGNKKLVASVALGKCEEILTPCGFARAHHRHLVNLHHLVRYKPGKEGGFIKLADCPELKVSRKRKAALLKALDVFSLTLA